MERKLTGWLILLIIILGPLQFGGGSRSIREVPDSFRPYLVNNPSLPTAIDIYQLLIGISVAVWVYTAWLLFRREPGTLKKIQSTFAAGMALRIVGSFSII